VKKIEISSKTFYRNHSASYFCSATIIDGHITSLYSEYGREGGEIWSPNHNANGTLQHCLTGLGRDFGMKFYSAVYKAAHNSKLLPATQAKSKIKQKEIKFAKAKVDRAGKALREAVAELNKLKRS